MFYLRPMQLLLLFGILINCITDTSQIESFSRMSEGVMCVTDLEKSGSCLLIENCADALALIRNEGCILPEKIPIGCCEDLVLRTPPIATQKCIEYTKHQLSTTKIRLSREIGGFDANPLQFPHMAILGYGNSSNTRWLCGGSLISENFVLTAAHCIDSKFIGKVSVVKLGVHQISEPSQYVQVFTVKNTYIHPEYDSRLVYHDIALIELDRTADISSGVKPACLHTSKRFLNNYFTSTGWGVTELGGEQSDILQKVNLRYVPNDNCQKFYNSMRRLPDGIIDDWQICADGGRGHADTCQGDAGGPIQLPRVENTKDSLHTIIGITSFGRGCGIAPSVYTRISHYVPWIESIVWPK